MNTHISAPESSLRRTPYASVKACHPIHRHRRSGPGEQSLFHRYRIFDENDLRSSTHTVVYDSSKTIHNSTALPIRKTIITSDDTNMIVSSVGGSGNESDYDNNNNNNDYSTTSRPLSLSTRHFQIPVNNSNPYCELTRTDDLLLGDQNEIILNNDSNIHSVISDDNNNDDNGNDDDNDDDDYTEARVELSDDNGSDINYDENTIQSTIINNNQQSDNNIVLSTNSLQPLSNRWTTNLTSMKSKSTRTLDDSPSSIFPDHRRDPLTTRKLLDIRSHLLLNTTLDAT